MVKQKMIDTASKIYLIFALILLYLPILILIISSLMRRHGIKPYGEDFLWKVMGSFCIMM